MPEYSHWIIQDATPKIVDALLTLCWCSVDALLTLCWRSVDALLTLSWGLFLGVATSTINILALKADNTSIMGKYRSTVLRLYKMQYPTSLTLRWHSFLDGNDISTNHISYKGGEYFDYG